MTAVLFSRSNWKGWSFSNVHLNSVATRAIFGTNHRKTSPRPGSNSTSVKLMRCFSWLKVSFAFISMPSVLCYIPWPTSSEQVSREKPFFSDRLTPEFSLITISVWLRCSSTGVIEMMTFFKIRQHYLPVSTWEYDVHHTLERLRCTL